MNIGPRVWKTGLAVAITLWVCDYFSLDQAFLAVVAAIISLQPTISDSFKKGWQRIVATIIGILVGIVLLFIVGSSPLSIGLGVIITILICVRYKLNDSLVLASITVVIIMYGYNDDMFTFFLQRTALPFLGVFVAIIINYFFSPPKPLQNVSEGLSKLNEGIEILFMKVTRGFFIGSSYDTEQAEKLIKDLYLDHEETKQCLEMLKNEYGQRRYLDGGSKDIKKLDRLLDILWLVAQRLFDIHKLTADRKERLKEDEAKSSEYNGLFVSVEELLYLIVSLQKNLLEQTLNPAEQLREIIEQQADEIKELREKMRDRIIAWQEKHQGLSNINSLIEFSTLIYDLNKICDYLFRFKEKYYADYADMDKK
ncbi:MAG: aromatic acid exporter family protein [Dethiobacteria bacterium]|jgi:uncharacterized membrane protein YgaE (UPF0421/DUF939 family)|nr:aromatic acid exporter family protein [Bacillota bacterium]